MTPIILVSNDDGHRAPGVHHLTRLLSRYGRVVAVCPESPQSGKSMAITGNTPLRMSRLYQYQAEEPEVEWYSVDGTPVDCIKIAMHTIFRDGERPALVCTGINHGSNASINVIYSGTMGAAFEGCANNIPSIGFSLCDHSMNADFSPMIPYIDRIVSRVMERGLPEGVCLNVNAPDVDSIKGMRVTRACRGRWSDEYKEYVDPFGKPYYWLTGRFINEEPEESNTDDALLKEGYLTIVGCSTDRTVPLPSDFFD